MPPHSVHGSVRSRTFGSGLIERVYGRTRAAGVQRGVLHDDRRGPAFGASLACHLAVFATLVLVMRHGGHTAHSPSVSPDREMPRMVWLNAPGPGGGGGGGGNRMKEPPRRAELPGHDVVTVPAAKPRVVDPSKPITAETAPIPSLVIPVATLASATETLPGSIAAPQVCRIAGTRRGQLWAQTGDSPRRGPQPRRQRTGGHVYQQEMARRAYQEGEGRTAENRYARACKAQMVSA